MPRDSGNVAPNDSRVRMPNTETTNPKSIKVIVEQLPAKTFNWHDYLPAILGVLVGTITAMVGWCVQRSLNRDNREQQWQKDRQEKEEHDFGKCSEAMFAICCMWNSLLHLRPTLREYIDDPLRWARLPEIPQTEGSSPRIEIGVLAPILLKTHSNLLFQLFLLQKNFDKYVNALRLFSEKRRQLADANTVGKPTQYIEIHVKALSDYLFSGFDELIRDLRDRQKELHEAIKDQFPKSPAPYFKVKDEDGIRSSSVSSANAGKIPTERN